MDEHTVRFRYRDAQTGRDAQRVLPGAEFLKLVLQHVLPKGFRRARNFGYLHPEFHMHGKRLIALLHLVLKYLPPCAPQRKPRSLMQCPCCGAPMQIVRAGLRILAPPDLIGGALPM